MNEHEVISHIVRNRYTTRRQILNLICDFLVCSKPAATILYEEKILPKLDYIPHNGRINKRCPLTEQDKLDVVEAYRRGESKSQLEKRYKTSYDTINNLLSEAGLY